MTDQTTAAQATVNSDTSAQSTAATTTTTAAQPAADAVATAHQQKPADSASTQAADASAKPATNEGDKPANTPEGDTNPAAPKAPEKYEPFALPDGVKLAPEAEAEVTAKAKELNLPQEGAQKLVDAALKLQASFSSQMESKIQAIRAEWETNSRSDKEFGGDNFEVNLAVANTAVRAFGSPAFKQLLKDSGVGSHPEFIRTFLNIGKSISQDQLVTSDGTPTPEASGFTAAASKLYGGKK